MGLLDKVTTLKSRKSLAAKGLLAKTLSIVNSENIIENPNKQGSSLLATSITQEELDRLSHENKKKRKMEEDKLLKRASSIKPANVPLTWKNSHQPIPQYYGPIIQKQEVDNLFKKVSGKEGSKAVHSAQNVETDFIVSLKHDIAKTEEGIETPAFLFSLIKEKLNIIKGAILLYDPVKMLFVPWASCGYDETTLHHLRIPLGFSESFNETAEGKTLILKSKTELAPYKNFFSNREFNLLSQLIIKPFIFKNKLHSILILSDIGKIEDSLSLKDILDDISYVFSEKIYNAREQKMQLLKKIEPEVLDSLEKAIDKHITYALEKNNKPALILISLNDFIRQIAAETSNMIDLYRISEDIYKILRSLFYSMGSVFELEGGSYMVSIFKIKKPDFDMIFHQTSYVIRQFFVNVNKQQFESPDIKFSYKQYPENGNNSKELLADLI